MSLPPLQSASPSKTSVSHQSSVEPRGVPHFDREYAKQLSLARRGRSASQHSNIESHHSLSRAEQINALEHDVDAPNHTNNRNFLMEELPLHHLSESIRANVPKLKNFVVSHIASHQKSSSPLHSPSKPAEETAQTIQGLQTPTKTHSPVKQTTNNTTNKTQNSSSNKTLPFTSSNDQASKASSPSHSPKYAAQTKSNANEKDKHTSMLLKADSPANHIRSRHEHSHATNHATKAEVDHGSFVDSIKATLSPEFMLAPWRAAAAASTASANNSMTTNNTNRTNMAPYLSTSTLVKEPHVNADANTSVNNKEYDKPNTKSNAYALDGLESSLLTESIADQTNNANFQPALSMLGSTLATLPRSAISKLIHSTQSREWLKK